MMNKYHDKRDHYRNMISIAADRALVFAALTTVEGIEGW